MEQNKYLLSVTVQDNVFFDLHYYELGSHTTLESSRKAVTNLIKMISMLTTGTKFDVRRDENSVHLHTEANNFFFKVSSDGKDRIALDEHSDMVNSPKHYKLSNGMESIEVIKATLTKEEYLGWCKGNALKYHFRAGKKDPDKIVEDYRKSAFYTNEIVEVLNEP